MLTKLSVYELPQLLNYVSAPNVLIWSAVAASCSVPFLFSSTSLLAKDPLTGLPVPWNPSPQRWIDGSVDNDLPMTRLAEMFNVNHFIVSQVNPHVVPFLSKEEDLIAAEADGSETSSTTRSWGETAAQLLLGETLHRMGMMAELGIFKTALTKARSVLSQKYSGDINIFPEIPYADFPKMLKNPTPEFMFQATLRGERATWPKLSRIRNHCAIELALDTAIHQLRTRVVFSPSSSDLRLRNWSMGSPRGFGAAGANPALGVVVGNGRGRKASSRRRLRTGGLEDFSRASKAGGTLLLGRSRSTAGVRRDFQPLGLSPQFLLGTPSTPSTPFVRRASIGSPAGAGAAKECRLSVEMDYFTFSSNGKPTLPQPPKSPDSEAAEAAEDECWTFVASDSDSPDPTANSSKRRIQRHHHRSLSSTVVIKVPGRDDVGRSLGSRRGRDLVRMTRAGGDDEVVYNIGIGRAKSAEELRVLR